MTFTIPKIVFFSVFYQENGMTSSITQDRSHFIINRIPCQQGVNINCKQPFHFFIRMNILPIFYIYLSNKAMGGSPLMNQIINLSPKCQFDQELSLVPHKFLVQQLLLKSLTVFDTPTWKRDLTWLRKYAHFVLGKGFDTYQFLHHISRVRALHSVLSPLVVSARNELVYLLIVIRTP